MQHLARFWHADCWKKDKTKVKAKKRPLVKYITGFTIFR